MLQFACQIKSASIQIENFSVCSNIKKYFLKFLSQFFYAKLSLTSPVMYIYVFRDGFLVCWCDLQWNVLNKHICCMLPQTSFRFMVSTKKKTILLDFTVTWGLSCVNMTIFILMPNPQPDSYNLLSILTQICRDMLWEHNMKSLRSATSLPESSFNVSVSINLLEIKRPLYQSRLLISFHSN